MAKQVVGVDVAKQQWVSVRLEENRVLDVHRHPKFTDVLEANPTAEVLAVDIPIGLPSTGRRRADQEARNFVGVRRSSVFYCPPRDVVLAADYGEAKELARRLTGKSLSKQTHALREKILEVEAFVELSDRIYEVHPEVCG